MVKSMTGYGRAVETVNGREFTVEIRSVNNRYLDCTVKLPRSFSFAEEAVKAAVKAAVSRGKVDVFIPHLAVGLDMAAAVKKIAPKEVLMSHILELGHAITKWRWSYEYGINECEKLQREGVYLPVWGEKLVMKR